MTVIMDKEKALEEKSDCGASETTSSNSDESVGRGTWNRQFDFFLSLVGYAIGLGNLWRFPYLCMRNGGGAFLIPYFLFLALCAMPLYFLELIVGQFSSLSPVSIWRISPAFKGVGYGMLMVSGVVCIYYNVIMAWSLYYLVMSFTLDTLPWASCDNWWNTESCMLRQLKTSHELSINATAATPTAAYIAELLYDPQNTGTDGYNGSALVSVNDSSQFVANITSNMTKLVRTTPAEEFWNHYVLQISSGIEEPGCIRWQLLVCLAVAWVTVFLCLFKGVQSLGKVVYVTATMPYLMLLVLFFRGATLPGAWNGIKYYLYPDFSRLLHFSVWCEACAQIFYSLGMAYGGLITMSSYNKFSHNCYRNAVMVPIINCITSFFAGFVVFSILGYMAHMAGVEVSEVVTSGPGLVFVVYPEALAMLPGSAVWSALFFSMLFVVGLDTQFGMFETVISGIVDEFPLFFKGWRKTALTGFVCFVQFLLGIPLVTQGGIYVFQLFDWYSATFALMTIAFLECIVLGWIYGSSNVYSDLELMIGRKPCKWWEISWKFISPAMLMMVLIFTIAVFSPPSYGDYEYPGWAIAIGWSLALCSVVPIPIYMSIYLSRGSGSLTERWHRGIKPARNWGPALEANRKSTRYSVTEATIPLQDSSSDVNNTV